jgi:hypothetical protein
MSIRSSGPSSAIVLAVLVAVLGRAVIVLRHGRSSLLVAFALLHALLSGQRSLGAADQSLRGLQGFVVRTWLGVRDPAKRKTQDAAALQVLKGASRTRQKHAVCVLRLRRAAQQRNHVRPHPVEAHRCRLPLPHRHQVARFDPLPLAVRLCPENLPVCRQAELRVVGNFSDIGDGGAALRVEHHTRLHTVHAQRSNEQQ